MPRSNSTKLNDIDTSEDIEPTDLAVLNSILDIKNRNSSQYETLKYVMFATALFAILSLPFTDRIIELAFPLATSWLILVGMKSVLFFILFYIIYYSNI